MQLSTQHERLGEAVKPMTKPPRERVPPARIELAHAV